MHVVEHIDTTTIGKLLTQDAAAGQAIKRPAGKSAGGRAYGVVTKHGRQHDRHIASGAKATEVPRWVHTVASKAKAFLLGTFHGIDRKHLQCYLEEFCYRFNRRRWQGQLFDRLVTACAGSIGITYAQLTR